MWCLPILSRLICFYDIWTGPPWGFLGAGMEMQWSWVPVGGPQVGDVLLTHQLLRVGA